MLLEQNQPDLILHQLRLPCSPFLCDLTRSSKPLFIPNHQALFLRIAYGGAKRVEMTQIIKLHAFRAEDPPILISISLARHVPLSCRI